jgi:hypothetical protein
MNTSFTAGGPVHNIGARMQRVLSKEHVDTGARERATVAGGCFWGLELAFQRIPGVVQTSVGYINGHMPNPDYDAVCSGRSGESEPG